MQQQAESCKLAKGQELTLGNGGPPEQAKECMYMMHAQHLAQLCCTSCVCLAAQGHETGAVTLTPLASVGVSLGSPAWLLGSLAAEVTCLSEHTVQHTSGAILLGGCRDGSVAAWDTSTRTQVLRLRVHAAAVSRH